MALQRTRRGQGQKQAPKPEDESAPTGKRDIVASRNSSTLAARRNRPNWDAECLGHDRRWACGNQAGDQAWAPRELPRHAAWWAPSGRFLLLSWCVMRVAAGKRAEGRVGWSNIKHIRRDRCELPCPPCRAGEAQAGHTLGLAGWVCSQRLPPPVASAGGWANRRRNW
jgi:hypothetical protein